MCLSWFLLTSLNKVGEEKDELRDSISQLKHHINDLIVSIYAQKETFITYRRAEIAESQTQNLIV